MLVSKNAATASLPRMRAPSGLVTLVPIGSSIRTSSDISANHPSRSRDCTHRQEDCAAVSAGDCWSVCCHMGFRSCQVAVERSVRSDCTGGAGAVLGRFADEAKPTAVAGCAHVGVGHGGGPSV